MESEQEQRGLPQLDGQGVGKAVHRRLVLVLGVHHKQIDAVFVDEATELGLDDCQRLRSSGRGP